MAGSKAAYVREIQTGWLVRANRDEHAFDGVPGTPSYSRDKRPDRYEEISYDEDKQGCEVHRTSLPRVWQIVVSPEPAALVERLAKEEGVKPQETIPPILEQWFSSRGE